MNKLRALVDVWQSAAAELTALARDLDPADWDRATDLPAWNVHDVMAHCAALESELSGVPPLWVEIDKTAPHLNGPTGVYTERGVVGRRERTPDELIAEFEEAVARRSAMLAAEPLDDPAGSPPITPGRLGWDWATLLRNRPLDLWVHQQDIRRAVDRPGGLDTTVARHVQQVYALGLGYVVAKRTGARPGATVVVDISGPVAATYAVTIGPDGRGRPAEPAANDPVDARLTMDTETFTRLGAGRIDPAQAVVGVEGDEALGQAIVAGLNLTP